MKNERFFGKTTVGGGRPGKRGFALLITITLLSFLVLLLVSLASLTRVETQVAGNTQNIAKARQNALMALNIAVGQLQKYAGPDNAVTARSELLSNGTNAYSTRSWLTGVWGTEGAAATSASPQMWLVSGSETATGANAATSLLSQVPDASVDIADQATSSQVFLVGNQSVAQNAASPTADEKKMRVKLGKRAITAPAGTVPGLTASATIGNYAWWVGDNGVKASLGLPDRAEEVNYGPWATKDGASGTFMNRRIRQQIGSGANYFYKAGTTGGFDPLDVNNSPFLKNIADDKQLSLLTPAGGDLPSYLRARFHDFTSASYSVLSNTLPSSDANRGLMRDLSIDPTELGAAFTAYANYENYMVAPTTTHTNYGTRQYRMQTYQTAASKGNKPPEFAFTVAPILSEFMLRFRVSRPSNTSSNWVVYSKLYVSMWNPYTSALVPPNAAAPLTLEIEGLPTITVKPVASTEQSYSATVDLQSTTMMPPAVSSGGKMVVQLRFDPTATGGSGADKASWLPGRAYSWVTNTGATPDNMLKFYSQDSDAAGGWRYQNLPALGGTSDINASGPTVGFPESATRLKVTLKNSTGEVLATYSAPRYSSFNTAINDNGWKFGYGFRLGQPNAGTDDRSWITQTADIRCQPVESGQLASFDSSKDQNAPFNPANYGQNLYPANLTQYLIWRPTTSVSVGNDTPLFELPRSPLLSLGELQHLPLRGGRLFSIGNSWGSNVDSGNSASVNQNANVNSLFDRYFFSGLTSSSWGPDLSQGQPLPNWNLRPIGITSLSSLRDGGNSLSSRYLLQGGGFNLNSGSVAAWRALLSRTRFPTSAPFAYSTANALTGAANATSSDNFTQDSTLGAGTPAPAFFRFPQSAQETAAWSKPPSDTRLLSVQSYRQGVRGSGSVATPSNGTQYGLLTTAQIETLATNIVTLLKSRALTAGPIRSLSAFLNPHSSSGNEGLIEKAIANSNINPAEIAPGGSVDDPDFPGFSSLTLTQADVMTALAPYLRTRSDTFVVRAYGDVTNPITDAVESRAWVEAVVQRLPAPLDATDQASASGYAQPSGAFGRQFKIVSMRWLSPSDV